MKLPPLSNDEVHVWCADLVDSTALVPQYIGFLSEEELKRAEGFHLALDRDRFIVTRGILRKILSRYLTTTPQQLEFDYSAFGKPVLVHDCGKLQFNVSHSHGVAMYAISLNREVGVDIERVRDFAGFAEIIKKYFTVEERSVLERLPESEKIKSFFKYWTQKEAGLKATGKGLAGLTKDCDLSAISLQSIGVTEEYVATLAVLGNGFRVKQYGWGDFEYLLGKIA